MSYRPARGGGALRPSQAGRVRVQPPRGLRDARSPQASVSGHSPSPPFPRPFSDDWTTFNACATGPALLYDVLNLPPACPLGPTAQSTIAADLDADGDVDAADFAEFQRSITTGQN